MLFTFNHLSALRRIIYISTIILEYVYKHFIKNNFYTFDFKLNITLIKLSPLHIHVRIYRKYLYMQGYITLNFIGSIGDDVCWMNGIIYHIFINIMHLNNFGQHCEYNKVTEVTNITYFISKQYHSYREIFFGGLKNIFLH